MGSLLSAKGHLNIHNIIRRPYKIINLKTSLLNCCHHTCSSSLPLSWSVAQKWNPTLLAPWPKDPPFYQPLWAVSCIQAGKGRTKWCCGLYMAHGLDVPHPWPRAYECWECLLWKFKSPSMNWVYSPHWIWHALALYRRNAYAQLAEEVYMTERHISLLNYL